MIALPKHLCVYIYCALYIKHSMQHYATWEVTMSLLGVEEEMGGVGGGNEEM
jgi:hypothetical protein